MENFKILVKKKSTENRGITMIALIVIIVVLLILASISISVLKGDNGIINQSKNSKEQHEIAGEKEKLKLAVSEAYQESAKKRSKDKEVRVDTGILENVLKSYDEISEVEESGEGDGVDATFKDSGRTYFVDTDGNVTETETDSSDKNKFKDNKNWTYTDSNGKTVMIGDYVSFDPKEGNSESANIFYSDRWQVLGIDSKGELELISTASISESSTSGRGLTLSGREGYSNAISKMNKMCEPYGKGTYAKNARSVNVDDINKVTGYDPEKQQYKKGETGEYGNKMKYTNVNGKIHYVSTNGKNPSSDTEVKYTGGFAYPNGENFDGTDWIDLKNGESVTMTSNYYEYYPQTMTDSYKSGTSINGDTSTGAVAAYNLLFARAYYTLLDENGGVYWLASLCNTTYSNTMYGVRIVSLGVQWDILGDTSSNKKVKYTNGVRPVVTLKPNVKISGGSGTYSKPWTIGL